MKFLTEPECERWCSERGRVPPRRLRERPLPGQVVSHHFAIPNDAHGRVALCRILWNLSGESLRGERLLWINGWSVWPSGEHMPLFTRWRAAFGENRTLMEACGNVVQPGEDADGLSILVVASLFLWDCWMYAETGAVAMISHDEFGFVLEPRDHGESTVRAQLNKLGVLQSS